MAFPIFESCLGPILAIAQGAIDIQKTSIASSLVGRRFDRRR